MDVAQQAVANPDGGEFWKDIPDDILEELYKQLNQGHPGGISVDGPEQLNEAAPAAGWQQASATWGLRHSGAAPPDALARGESTLSSIFRAPSLPVAPPPAVPKAVDPSVSVLPVPPPVSPQYLNENAKAKTMIEQIIQMHNNQEQQLEQQRQYQQHAILQSQGDTLRQLAEQVTKLAQQIDLELTQLHQVNKSVLLDHSNLHHTRLLALRLQHQLSKVELLKQELQHVLSGAAPKTVATLLITEQPLPQVVFKGKVLEDPYVVQLITGAHQDVQALSKVKATLVSEDHSWKSAGSLENDVAGMDAFQRIALFHNVKVNVSTRMSPVQLKFTMQVTSSKNQAIAVESIPSYSLIVITNESQWCDAAGKLILQDAFAGQPEVAWPTFANSIHHHFLKATRQDPSRPSRGLNEADWTYIHSKFFNSSPTINQPQASQFWQFFGPVVCTLRFKRHINNLWFVGLIYGFITKEECNSALMTQDLGTFMIRFSESFPGLFAVAYVSDDPYERVKHYLVKHEDISSNKTLPDFLHEKPQFQFCYQLDTPSGTLRRYPRDVVLSSYYSKARKVSSGSNGYVLL